MVYNGQQDYWSQLQQESFVTIHTNKQMGGEEGNDMRKKVTARLDIYHYVQHVINLTTIACL